MLGNHLHLRLSLRRSFIDLVDQGPKSEGSEVIATRANLPIKTAFKTRSGMSPQNSLSGQSLRVKQGGGVDTLLLLSFVLHCGDQTDVGNGLVAVQVCQLWLHTMTA